MNRIRLAGYWAVAAFLLSGASTVQAQDSQGTVPETDEQAKWIENFEHRLEPVHS